MSDLLKENKQINSSSSPVSFTTVSPEGPIAAAAVAKVEEATHQLLKVKAFKRRALAQWGKHMLYMQRIPGSILGI